jgi:trehalose/maltose hydrolase-like predicted phosphorylase
MIVRTLHPAGELAVRTSLPDPLRRRFEAVAFDWDGTAVPDRPADANDVRHLVEALCSAALDVFVVSGTHVGSVDGQLKARTGGPGHLFLCLNRGSEVFEVGPRGPRFVWQRVARPEEEQALDRAARLTVVGLAERGLSTEIVSQRLNRRKIDLIPVPDWADPPKARIGELVEAVEARLRAAGLDGLPEVAAIASAASTAAGLAHPRVTSDAKHVEIGLTDKSDAGRWIAERLRLRGMTPAGLLLAGDEFGPLGRLPGSDSLILVRELTGSTAFSVGPEPSGTPEGVIHVGGGPPAFLDVLRDQLERRRRGEIPVHDHVPTWTIVVEGLDPRLERVHESLLTIADGRIGTSGSPLLGHPAATPQVLAAGVYEASGPNPGLMPGPVWSRLGRQLHPEDSLWRALDLRTGTLWEEVRTAAGQTRSLRFSSLARPGVTVLRAEGQGEMIRPGPWLAPPDAGIPTEAGRAAGFRWRMVGGRAGGIAAVAVQRDRRSNRNRGLDRFAAYEPDPAARPRRANATRAVRRAAEAGFDRLLTEHRVEWARRWEDADVVVAGDDDLQHSIRVALFHLIGSVADSGEAAVGARGLSGPAYLGHVFWDSDVFVLPFLAATHPAAARAMLEYRIRRLPAAREAARAIGRSGARFPWESAGSGIDVTPRSARDRTGRLTPIRTGLLEDHIIADVAWAASCYADWTGDQAFLTGPGGELLVETARYWVSRSRFDSEGHAHIYGVIGPDEYHEPVDDNAYTNVMARWNLRRAAQSASGSSEVGEFERLQWVELADALVDGYDPSSKLYEQFAGFFALEPMVISEVAPKRPIAADLFLGRERVRGAQVVKQADVLMLHHLVPDEVAPDSLLPNLEFYEPRTAHGSSLSPGIHAALFARVGRPEAGLAALSLAARMDLDDLTGTTAGGLHLATMGSLWQALVYGFAGIRVADGLLRVDPKLPDAWEELRVPVRFRGHRIQIHVRRDEMRIQTDGPVRLQVGAPARALSLQDGEAFFRLEKDRWKKVSSG